VPTQCDLYMCIYIQSGPKSKNIQRFVYSKPRIA